MNVMARLNVSEKFKSVIPPLTKEEYALLEESCLKEGIRDPLVVWNDTIIDGHNRYEIAERHQLPYEVFEKHFEDEDDAVLWMIDNQGARRSLFDYPKFELAYLRKEILLKCGRERMSEGGEGLSHCDRPSHSTRAELAKYLGWSETKVGQAEVIKKYASEDVKNELRKNALSIRKAYDKIKGKKKKAERVKDLEEQQRQIESGELPELEGKFEVISIDPPWPYGRKYDPGTSRVANPYPEMEIEEIAAIELPASDDAVLFLWTTHKFLPPAFNLLSTWGFEYKCTLVWNKEKMGMGKWLRMQCEFCLVAIKGKPFWENTTERDLINSPRREHSRKPDEFFELVDKICVGRKLEYFSREAREGWEIFGNETSKFNEVG